MTESWITNGQPADFPEPNDGWVHNSNSWIDNGQPADFPEPVWM